MMLIKHREKTHNTMKVCGIPNNGCFKYNNRYYIKLIYSSADIQITAPYECCMVYDVGLEKVCTMRSTTVVEKIESTTILEVED